MKEIAKLSPKEEFLAAFDKNLTENLLPIGWSQEKKDKVASETTAMKTKSRMFMSIPMVCKGPDCVFASTCPLQQDGAAPVTFPCPYEVGIVKNFMADYIEQLDIDPENLIELSQIRTLIDQEVQMIRVKMLLGKEHFIQENVVGIDPEGDVIFRKELHLGVELEDKILKRQQIFFKQFLATREAKAKVGLAALDSAASMSNLMMSMRDAQDKIDRGTRQRLGIVERDDYIEIPEEHKDGK